MSQLKETLKIPLIILLVCIVAATAVSLGWLKFPRFLPLGVVIAANLIAGITILVCVPLVAVRFFRRSWSERAQDVAPPRLQWRMVASLLLTAAVVNLSIAYVCDFRDCRDLFLVGNVALPFLWILARRNAKRRLEFKKKASGS